MNGKMNSEPGRVPEELVNQFFDRELDEGSRDKFFGMLRGDLARCQEVARTQRIVAMLREPIPAPDLTSRILDRVEERRGFLPLRLRRVVTIGRLIAAACVLVAVLGVALLNRSHPGLFRLTAAPQPLSNVIESGKAEAAAGAQHLGFVIVPDAPSEALAARKSPLGGLTPGRIAVRTPGSGPESRGLVLPSGAGLGHRFVAVPGGIVDRETSAVLMLGAGVSPEAIERFIESMREAGLKGAPRPDRSPATSGR